MLNTSPPPAAKSWIVAGALVCALPAVGLLLSEIPFDAFTEFPPQSLYVSHAPFSWSWWWIYAAAGFSLLALLARETKLSIRVPRTPGWRPAVALALLGAAWAIAWNRWEWAAALQHHTFIGIWFSYILLLNLLCREIHGTAPLFDASRRYLLSFPLSALFWWGYEYLNRFTQNWHYFGIEGYSPAAYFVLASLSFSTVLPSVWITRDFIARAVARDKSPLLRADIPSAAAAALVTATALGLVALPRYPDLLFAGLWAAPLLLLLCVERLVMRRALMLRTPALWALAGLWCGFLWELWNSRSLAHWEYFVPFVHRFLIFEMPLVGYAGYIPFGLLCGLAIESLHPPEVADAQTR